MLIDFDAVTEAPQFQADICIVGAGAAGITLALELIPTGKKILLLEGGGLDSSEASQALYQMEVVSPRYQPTDTSRLRLFGGTTNHWEGSVRTLDPIDFQQRPWVHDSGWPFSYDDLLPFYERAFPYVEAGPLFLNEDPFIAHLGAYHDKIIRAGLACRLGYHSKPTRFGRRYLSDLQAAPNLTIVVNANLLSINEAANRRSVETLSIANYKRRTATVKAATYVIALGGMENARALLLSDRVTPGGIGNEYGIVGRYFMDHPVVKALVFFPKPDFLQSWGSGLVPYMPGRHALTLQASEETLRRHQIVNARMPLVWASESDISEGIEAAHQLQKGVTKGIFLPHVLSHLWNVFKDEDLIIDEWRNRGQPKSARARKFGAFVVDMMIEQRPDPENRIVLTDKRDALGLRKGKLFWRMQQQDKDDVTRLVDIFAKGAGAQALGLVRSSLAQDDTGRRFHELLNYGSHHMGSTRASLDPKKGVVDAHQRIHGRENIYVAGSSIFPTGGHVPPTATVVATTIRLADHLKGRPT